MLRFEFCIFASTVIVNQYHSFTHVLIHSPKPVTVTSVSANTRVRKHFKHALESTCAVLYNVTFVVGEGNTYTDSTTAYTQSTTSLVESINSDDFTDKLRNNSSPVLQAANASVIM